MKSPAGSDRFYPVQAGDGTSSPGQAADQPSGLLSEHVLPLAAAGTLLRRADGRPISNVTLWRWATAGIRSPHLPPGQKARLETVRLGQARYTSLEAIERFGATLDGRTWIAPGVAAARDQFPTMEQQGEAWMKTTRKTRRRRRDLEKARQRLIDAGLMERPR